MSVSLYLYPCVKIIPLVFLYKSLGMLLKETYIHPHIDLYPVLHTYRFWRFMRQKTGFKRVKHFICVIYWTYILYIMNISWGDLLNCCFWFEEMQQFNLDWIACSMFIYNHVMIVMLNIVDTIVKTLSMIYSHLSLASEQHQSCCHVVLSCVWCILSKEKPRKTLQGGKLFRNLVSPSRSRICLFVWNLGTAFRQLVKYPSVAPITTTYHMESTCPQW